MLKKFRFLMLLVLSVISTACHHSNTKPDYTDLKMCPEERPQICTREYNPVCATLNDGSNKTYSTGCTSCSDNNVVGYNIGKC